MRQNRWKPKQDLGTGVVYNEQTKGLAPMNEDLLHLMLDLA